MKKAFIITVYHQPAHLQRLVRALEHRDARFYVHVDKRVDAAPFKRLVGNRDDVLFVARKKVNWMGFSQVESILALMQAAVADGVDYISLLSGSDYPIKPAQTIMDFFSKAREEFLAFWRLDDRPDWLHKVQYYYPIDLIPIKDYQSAGFRRYFWGYFYRLHECVPRRKRPEFELFGGSDWWSMSGACANYVLEYVAAHQKYVRFYKYSHCPSEMFFHSIVLNSPFAPHVKNYDAYQKWRKQGTAKNQDMLPETEFNLRYIDWSGVHTGRRECPAVLDERDFDALLLSPALFARKFEEKPSFKLLQMIDKTILRL